MIIYDSYDGPQAVLTDLQIEQLKERWRAEYGAVFGRQYTIQFDYKPPLPDHLEARWSRLCDRYASKHPEHYFFFTEENKWPILVTHIK